MSDCWKSRRVVTILIDLAVVPSSVNLFEKVPYALCSVAVDLKISQVVDVPNVLVSAFLPLDIFASI
jgi:acetamidase/formamidase